MTMTLIPSHRRSRGKLVILAALVVMLLQASSTALKMGPKRFRSVDDRRSLVNTDDGLIPPVHSPSMYDESYVASRRSGGKGSGGKGKGGVSRVAECHDSCFLTTYDDTFSPTAAPTRSPTDEKPEKPECCKGGVSSLKVIYQGPLDGTLYLPSYEGLESLDIVDPCDNDGSADSGNRRRLETRSLTSYSATVKFVSCSQCFPDGSASVSPSCDFASESVDVQSGEEVCMAAFDSSGTLSLTSKFETDLEIFFSASGRNQVIQVTLHTSCSKPIHPPYAISLDYCESDRNGYPFYLDLDMIDLASLTNLFLLVFVDGTSREYPGELFSNCGSGTTIPDDDHCCKGGASFLKVRAGGFTTDGVLTFNATLARDCARVNASSGSGSGSQSHGAQASTLRFVSCEDECLDDPFGDEECTTGPSDGIPVISDEFICFGSWDESTNRIDFGSKMPTNLELFFVPDDTDSFPVQSTYVHLSCSKPLYGWAQVFAEDCSSSNGELVALEDIEANGLESSFYLAFQDGVSTSYYEEAKDLVVDINGTTSFFDVFFSKCACNCNATEFSVEEALSPAGPPTEASEQTCEEYVSKFCVFKDENGLPNPADPCVLRGGGNEDPNGGGGNGGDRL